MFFPLASSSPGWVPLQAGWIRLALKDRLISLQIGSALQFVSRLLLKKSICSRVALFWFAERPAPGQVKRSRSGFVRAGCADKYRHRQWRRLGCCIEILGSWLVLGYTCFLRKDLRPPFLELHRKLIRLEGVCLPHLFRMGPFSHSYWLSSSHSRLPPAAFPIRIVLFV